MRAVLRLLPLILFALSCTHVPPPPPAPPPAVMEHGGGEDAALVSNTLDVPKNAPPSTTVLRAFVLGDGGDPGSERAVVDAGVAERLALSSTRAVMLMPGDLFYPRGLPDVCAKARGRIVDEYVERYANLEIFSVTGNHDHGDSHGAHPSTALREAFFDCADPDAAAVANVTHWPATCECVPRWHFVTGGGLAGSVDLGPVALVGYDSQTALTDAQPVADALQKAFAAAPHKPLLVMAHHPFETFGPHGQQPVHSAQDTHAAEYRDYLALVRPLVEAHKDSVALLVFGHDHLMEYVPSSPPELVSGAASKASALIVPVPPEDFAVGQTPGFAELDIAADGSMDVVVMSREKPRTFHIAAK